ncbi:hypothetical protein TUM20985_50420 [Mycobacterium antarcticum]|uniref:DUF1839 family protein n=1 Tax=unclassified Mycolicibacterium TaxID=2636767 RepID=UPI002395AC18|nr:MULTISPECIES: DUF1839 family protein [unclassified Mycolicibacterium]BDX34495.1 hypothetical protein TUM20985_50420 [Mycolicibacterium sp. TUM20985]GLP77699.1 hypothetical protein TUM20983_48090 [Mycolicibacterium sp. TUM20983]GLP81901.1 hypothetical protein TUM20984_33210 [Mycolicibacterium sp. TUM20984]
MTPSQLICTSPTVPTLRIDDTPATHQSHFTHDADRIWPETNCYVDLWIELLHSLGLDPVPSFAFVFSADHDGLQWSFIKPSPDDLRRLYGLDVTEENVWMPVLETVAAGREQGILHTVEVDGWWLPDTAGTSYRSEHVKTTIVPTWLDRSEKRMRYLHNAGLFELGAEDFDGIFNLAPDTAPSLPPYIERVRWQPRGGVGDAVAAVVEDHVSRRPIGNPVERLASGIVTASAWLPQAGDDRFHRWAFATLRQAGATAELAADLAVHVDGLFDGTAAAESHFRSVAAGAKAVQFKMARVARGRTVDVGPALDEMSRSWQSAMDLVLDAVL